MTSARTLPVDVGNDSRLGEFVDRDTLRFVRDFSHPASLIWAAITDAKEITRWFWPCTLFEAKAGGRYRFEDAGQAWGGNISVFEPPSLLELDMGIRFELYQATHHTRLVLTLKRGRAGWSPMMLAGFMGWLGRLTRLIDRVAQEETERFCADIWESMWPVYERLIRHHVTDGAKAIFRVHFAPNDTYLGTEAKAQLDELVGVLNAHSGLKVVIDGFGDDSCAQEESVRLSTARMKTAADYLGDGGIARDRIVLGFALGNYHRLVPSDTEPGRAFNRRVELRPIY